MSERKAENQRKHEIDSVNQSMSEIIKNILPDGWFLTFSDF